jgi:alpha-tubulin suppressor-like RCC1 family protein
VLSPYSFIRKLFKKFQFLLGILKANTIGLFSKRDFVIIAFFTLLGAGGVFAAGLITISTPDAQGAGYTASTACDENVTIKALTAPHTSSGQLYVATIALSDISQSPTTGCGGKIMQIALKINGQMSYASWSIAPSSTDGTFYLTGATTSMNAYYADTLLSPFQADGLTNVAISQIGVTSFNGSISAGYYYACALLSSGAVKCWGSNLYGQLGDGSTANATARTTPVDVSTLSSGVTAIAAGRYHACALLSTGAVKCWGQNTYGQLGDGSTTQSLTPVSVPDLSSGVIAIAAGERHTCAVLNTGAVKCWGNNDNGQLGDGSTTQSLTPVSVPDLSSGVTAIAAGRYHACAVLNTGAVKCWGWNLYGQLGDGSTTQSLTPVSVPSLSSGVTAIAAGERHTCALLSTGAVKCWGYNDNGQLGDGSAASVTPRTTPVSVSTLSSGVTAISTGSYHTCALLSTGAAKCWGANTSGRLGDGSNTASLTPVSVSTLSTGVIAIAAGAIHTCAVLNTGAVKCWGNNAYGQLGDGSITQSFTPVGVLSIP